jgi:hypothetical protein
MKLLNLEKEKREKLDQELAQRRLYLISRAQIVLFKTHMMSCKRLIKILKSNLMLFGESLSSLQTTMKHSQVK